MYPEMADEILGYFLRHPEMTESVTGVLRWRLLEESIHRRLDTGRAAFRFLLQQGFLQPVQVASATEEMFSLNPARRTAARRFVSAAQRRRRLLPRSGR